MTIIIKNKETLIFDDFIFRCSVGKNGTTKNKIESDKKTPLGTFNIGNLYFRSDKNKKPNTKLKCVSIKKNMGWCDDVNSKKYNKLIILPSNLKHEKLYIKDHIYDLVIVINYNMNPIVKNKGSAIFLHIAKKNYSPTKGCVAISKKNMIILLKNLGKKNKIIIY